MLSMFSSNETSVSSREGSSSDRAGSSDSLPSLEHPQMIIVHNGMMEINVKTIIRQMKPVSSFSA